MDNILEIENLSKSFGSVQAVDNLSFKVKRGELFAFLGVNGAGKSTTISIICGQLKKDGGRVIIDGENIDGGIGKVLPKLGVVFQSSVLDSALSVRDNLKSRAALYGITGAAFKKRYSELCSLLDFSELSNRPLSKLSGGQRRRIDIARALINKPEILILDEPTTGLDPQTRRLLWDVVQRLRKERGLTVLLTTHYMEEAADADYVVIIDSGKIAAEGTPLDLKNKYTGDYINIYGDCDISWLGLECTKIGSARRISVKNTAEATALIIKNPEIFTDYEVYKGKMDDVFLAVTGKNLTGGSER